jgi:hypothetical protein
MTAQQTHTKSIIFCLLVFIIIMINLIAEILQWH